MKRPGKFGITAVVLCALLLAAAGAWRLSGDRTRSLALYPLTWLELRAGAPAASHSAMAATASALTGADCAAFPAAHRGGARGAEFPGNSRASVAETLRRGIRGIEVDLTVLEDGAVLEHDDLGLPEHANRHDYEKRKGAPAFPLDEFLREFAPRFARVIFDFKFLTVSRERALELLRGLPFRPDAHVLISLNCPLMTALQRQSGVPAGCELQGVLGNRGLGLRIWSANYAEVTPLQLELNRWAGLRPVFWTYPTPAELGRFCPAGLETALIEVI